ncbi:hypothetical protein RBWH47_03360 [Rhodopirellula baltica WH47]|uniref:Uncharacterized protein n=1 Tax=Rhodopirellula baltica WH47 TaxID=991778 RepID=F2APZ2_RHOBT|nr:hypothetical protein RBWH47_03360 [Rhodopirellula baltica WH47]
MLDQRLPISSPINEFGITVPVRFFAVRRQEVSPATSKIAAEVT